MIEEFPCGMRQYYINECEVENGAKTRYAIPKRRKDKAVVDMGSRERRAKTNRLVSHRRGSTKERSHQHVSSL